MKVLKTVITEEDKAERKAYLEECIQHNEECKINAVRQIGYFLIDVKLAGGGEHPSFNEIVNQLNGIQNRPKNTIIVTDSIKTELKKLLEKYPHLSESYNKIMDADNEISKSCKKVSDAYLLRKISKESPRLQSWEYVRTSIKE